MENETNAIIKITVRLFSLRGKRIREASRKVKCRLTRGDVLDVMKERLCLSRRSLLACILRFNRPTNSEFRTRTTIYVEREFRSSYSVLVASDGSFEQITYSRSIGVTSVTMILRYSSLPRNRSIYELHPDASNQI